ncbi:hypothetical protein [Granulicella sibirica]|uniref:Uncharacterized protein n=1 Tax=Granulicella sibirica TaxID=2479048 RepID=A0A4Q0T7C2_9BACT|nr:hypothetical protein [Granulicella sibirica]RXH57576.1 hypothetical protein GRAN_0886 [Granulicella sibirica]
MVVNLRNQSGLTSIDLTTDYGAAFPRSPQDRYDAGRWIVEGSLMVILLHVNSGESLLCTLKGNMHTDVYTLDASGLILAVSQEEYRRTH